MKGMFSLDGRLYRALETVWQLIVLNVMFVVGALPVVTIGAGLIALYDGAAAIDDGRFSVRRFWRVYADRFTQGLLLEGCVALGGAAVAIPVVLMRWHGLPTPCVLPLMAVFSMLLLTAPYCFAVPGLLGIRGVRAVIVRAVACALAHVPSSALVTVAPWLIGVCAVLAWRLLPVWCCLAFALCAWMQRPLLVRALAAGRG